MSSVPNFSATSFAMASTASVERTSSFCRRTAFLMSATLLSSTSVAISLAPSAANASAIARPIPSPAAVTSATLFFRRWTIRHPPLCITTTAQPVDGSVAVAGHRALSNALVFDGRREHHAIGKLIHHAALDLLPGRLTFRIAIAALFLQFGAPARQFVLRHQHVRRAFVEIETHAVAGLEQRQPAADGGFRRGIDDRRRGRGAGLTSIADARQRCDAALEQAGG